MNQFPPGIKIPFTEHARPRRSASAQPAHDEIGIVMPRRRGSRPAVQELRALLQRHHGVLPGHLDELDAEVLGEKGS